MINKKIVVAVLARDCNESLVRNIPRVEYLRSFFVESCVVVVENDSKDGTKETLQNWAKDSNNVTVISNDYGTATINASSKKEPYPEFGLGRIEKMARYRNIYMDYIRENIIGVDYVIMLDIDVLYFDVKGVIASVESAPNDWGGLLAFGRIYSSFKSHQEMKLSSYYDMYAYCDEHTIFPITRKSILKGRRALTQRISSNQYLPCDSAFGGLGIYKWEYINELHYIVEHNDNKDVRALCEHIPFNRSVRAKGGGLYIAREMVLVYGISSRIEFIKKWILPRWLRKQLKALRSYIRK